MQRLIERIFRPDRTRAPDVDATIARASSAEHAWETLAAQGLVPFEWVDAPTRRFRRYPRLVARALGDAPKGSTLHAALTVTHEPCWPIAAENLSQGMLVALDHRGYAWSVSGRPPVEAHHPVTLACCASIALDTSGILRAELLAREAAIRLAPWGARPVERTVWIVAPTGDHYPDALVCAALGIGQALPQNDTRKREFLRLAAKLRAGVPAVYAAAYDDNGGALWADAAARGAHIDRVPWAGPAVKGKAFASLPNPFEPLLAIWSLGYMLHALRGDCAVLVAAEAEPR